MGAGGTGGAAIKDASPQGKRDDVSFGSAELPTPGKLLEETTGNLLAHSEAPVLAEDEQAAQEPRLTLVNVGIVARHTDETCEVPVHRDQEDTVVGLPDGAGVKRRKEAAGRQVNAAVLAEVVFVELEESIQHRFLSE